MPTDGEAELSAHAAALASGVREALPRWVERCVDRVYRAWAGPPTREIRAAATEAGRQAVAEMVPVIEALLAADIDTQRTTPLALVRECTRYPTQVLHDAGVPPIQRDAMTEGMFPADVYALTPASFADIDPTLGDLGLAWGAAKAWVHRRRHG